MKKRRKYLFVCDDVKKWEPIVEDVSVDIREDLRWCSDFEVCGLDSIEERHFDYFNKFERIYSLDGKSVERLQERFGLESYIFRIFKFNVNGQSDMALGARLFQLIHQDL